MIRFGSIRCKLRRFDQLIHHLCKNDKDKDCDQRFKPKNDLNNEHVIAGCIQ